MRSHCFGFAAALLLAVLPSAVLAAQDRQGAEPKAHQIVLRGCVVPGENDTYALTKVVEAPGADGLTMPEVAHGRRVVFWLKDDDEVREHKNMMVEVTGRFADLQESEVELKPGPHDDGGLIVEFEGPGDDVRVSNDAVGRSIGTAGRQTPEANDVEVYLAEVDVTGVKALDERCE